MKVLLVVLIVISALLYLPTAARANTPDCPMVTSVPDGPPRIHTGRCESPGRAAGRSNIGDASRSGTRSGSRADRPGDSVRSAQASQNAGAGDMARDPAAVEAKAQAKYHTVKTAENLSKIAKIYNTPVEVLLLVNPHIVNPHLIHADDQLRIPSPEETERLREEAKKIRIAEQRRIAADVPHQGKRWVDVDLQTQTVRAYEGDTLLNTFIASTGTAQYPTVTGQFKVWVKLKADDMKGPGYDLKAVPYVMYFFEDYALHGTYWHNNFGTPMSHGCVNLRTEDAAWLFDFGHVGMLVNVH